MNLKAESIRVKFFIDAYVSDIEREVNDWLRDNPDYLIKKIIQSSSGNKTTISVWYLTGINKNSYNS